MEKKVKLELVQYPYSKSGLTLYLDDEKIAGQKAFGVGKTVASYELTKGDLKNIQRIVTRELNRVGEENRGKADPIIIACNPESDGSFPVRYYEEQEVKRVVEENLIQCIYMLNKNPILRKDGITIELTPHPAEQNLLICVEKIDGSHTALETRHYEIKVR